MTEVKVQQTKVESDNEPVAVFFGKDDPENPQDGWSSWKKWRVLFVALFITFTSTFNSAGEGAVSAGFRKEHPNISSELFITSNFAYQLMLGIGPLLLSPISETFGRRNMLIALTALITVLFLPQALAPNFASILATRFFQGAAGSVEGPVIAGVVADLFAKKNRGRAMATFVCAVYFGNGLGPTLGNWIAFKTSWHWCYWFQMIMSGTSCLLVIFFLPETRGEVLLQARAIKSEKETGRPHYIPGGVHAHNWVEAFKKSSTRPLVYLFTEPIVAGCACWIGFAWGVVFLYIGAVAHVFTETYGFNQGTSSTVLICGCIGSLIGWVQDQTIQERLYQRSRREGNGVATPEARLYSSTAGGILFSVGAFGFAWTARPWIHWIAPCIFVTMSNVGSYIIYLATYQYLAEVYGTFSSSAQAAQSLLRGILGAVFPFFGVIMYDNLTFKWASTLVGFVSAGFAIVPFVMIKYGAQLRARSKIAVQLAAQEPTPLGDVPQEQTIAV
ncbi:hypothetical protein MNV49_002692 [Pseudohyphozyma bogoriensis]|nr:hypothetical protein MNV49_002692 [Pseudohyphozyma bogoriensis]